MLRAREGLAQSPQKAPPLGACSVAASRKPPKLVTRVRPPACACFSARPATHSWLEGPDSRRNCPPSTRWMDQRLPLCSFACRAVSLQPEAKQRRAVLLQPRRQRPGSTETSGGGCGRTKFTTGAPSMTQGTARQLWAQCPRWCFWGARPKSPKCGARAKKQVCAGRSAGGSCGLAPRRPS